MKIAKKMDKLVVMLLFSISTIGLSAQNRLNNLFDVRNNKPQIRNLTFQRPSCVYTSSHY